MSWNNLINLKLENDKVQIRRIGLADREDFFRIAFDEAIWQYFVTKITSSLELDRFMEEGIKDTLTGNRIVFAIIDRISNKIVGSTAFGNISEKERKLEIGWSWLSKDAQGTGINRAVKFLLLDYSFNNLKCERVEFKTDILNVVARRGLAALGAKEEGVLRSFNFMPSGHRRDVVYYSILRSEWPVLRREKFGQ